MLPSEHRLTRSADFTEVVRGGHRAGRRSLTVHLLPGRDGPARAGLVVSKAVGGSVVRHQVARQLRHLLLPHVRALPPGTRLVVRAAPPAATAGSTVLGAELAGALRTAVKQSKKP